MATQTDTSNVYNVTGSLFKAVPNDYTKGAWNAAAFADAAANAQATHGTLYVPNGTWHIAKGGTSSNGTTYGLGLPGGGFKIVGESIKGTVLKYCAAVDQGGAFDSLIAQPETGAAPGSEALLEDLVVSDLTLDGLDATLSSHAKYGFKGRHFQGILLDRVRIKESSASGALVWGTYNVLRNCDLSYNLGDGLQLLNGKGNRVAESTFYANNRLGVVDGTSSCLTISKCRFELNGNGGIYLFNAISPSILGCEFESQCFNAGHDGIIGAVAHPELPGGLLFATYGSRVYCDIYLNKGGVDNTDPLAPVYSNSPTIAGTSKLDQNNNPTAIISGCYTRLARGAPMSFVAGNAADELVLIGNSQLDNQNYGVNPFGAQQPSLPVYQYFADGTNGLLGKFTCQNNKGFLPPSPLSWVSGQASLSDSCESKIDGIPNINLLQSNDFTVALPSVMAQTSAKAHKHSAITLDATRTYMGDPVYTFAGSYPTPDPHGVTINVDDHPDLAGRMAYLAFRLRNVDGRVTEVETPWGNMPTAVETFSVQTGSNGSDQFYSGGRYTDTSWGVRSCLFQFPNSGLVTVGLSGNSALSVTEPVLGLLGAPYSEVVGSTKNRVSITTPADLSDVVLWFDADDAVFSGSNLTTWPARKSNLVFGPTAVPATLELVNDYPGIRTQVNGYLQWVSGSLTIAPPYTIIAVCSVSAAIGGGPIILGDATHYFRILHPNDSTSWNVEVAGSQTGSIITATEVSLYKTITRLSTATGAGNASINGQTATVSGTAATLTLGSGSVLGFLTAGNGLVINEILVIGRDTIPSELILYFQRKYNLTLT